MTYAPTVCTGPRTRLFDHDPVDWDGATIAIGDRVRLRGETRFRYVIGIVNDDPKWIIVDYGKRSTQGQQVLACNLIHVL